MSITATSGSGSLVARATLPNKNIATAELVTLQVSAESRTGGIVSVGVDFGDGTPTSMPGPAVGAPCGPGPAPTQHAVGYDHAFRVSGTFTIVVMAVTDNCHGSERAQTHGQVRVRPGGSPTNGPRQPSFYEARQERCNGETCSPPATRDPSKAYIQFVAVDHDGYISQVTVDWHDGSANSVFTRPLSDCRDPMRYWPSSELGAVADHRYARPGTYGAELTVGSVGCTGRDRQVAKITLVVTSS
jgi:hypothetical protein